MKEQCLEQFMHIFKFILEIKKPLIYSIFILTVKTIKPSVSTGINMLQKCEKAEESKLYQGVFSLWEFNHGVL